MGTNCAPLVADLSSFCYERYFTISLSDDKQADIIETLNARCRHLEEFLNINNIYFDNMVRKINPAELHFIKQIPLILKPRFWTCILFISNDIVYTKIYDKRDDFVF